MATLQLAWPTAACFASRTQACKQTVGGPLCSLPCAARVCFLMLRRARGCAAPRMSALVDCCQSTQPSHFVQGARRASMLPSNWLSRLPLNLWPASPTRRARQDVSLQGGPHLSPIHCICTRRLCTYADTAPHMPYHHHLVALV